MKNKFTLIEVVASMAIFLIITTILMQFFNSAQQVWLKSRRNRQIYENARMAMNLICTDLQGIVYNNNNDDTGIYPIWHEDTDKLYFISATDNRGSSSDSDLCEIKYTLADGSTVYNNGLSSGTLEEEGWIVRSCTDDVAVGGDFDRENTDNKYNFNLYPRDSIDGSYTSTQKDQRVYRVFKDMTGASTNPSSSDYQGVIPYVTSLEFVFRDEDGDDLEADKGFYSFSSANDVTCTPLPNSIDVSITLLDEDSWKKWNESGNDDIRDNNQRTFKRTVFLGNRRQ